jgi:hypothetical protein
MIDEAHDELNASVRLLAEGMREPMEVRPEWRDALLARLDTDARAPRGWNVRPWMAIAAALAIFAGGITAGRLTRASGKSSAATGTTSAAVRFVYVAPQAKSVALVGDFNQWNPTVAPLKKLADGTWIVDLPLGPGRYAYAFLVDGTLQADPAAPRATPRDDFGFANSVLMVRGL